MDPTNARYYGIQFALQTDFGRAADFDDLMQLAARFAQQLVARPHTLVLFVSPITREQMSAKTSPTATKEDGMGTSLQDTQQVLVSVMPEDSKGFPVADTLTWSESSGGVNLSLVPSADGLSCMVNAVAPGTGIVVSVTDGNFTATESFDVTAGGVAQLVLSVGTPQDQPAAPTS